MKHERGIMKRSGHYVPKEIVGSYDDKFGNEQIVHRPKGRKLRVLRDMNTAPLRMNRVAAPMIGERIKARREAAGMTLAELAQRAGLASQTPKEYMWSIENAVRDNGVRIGTLFAIARALGCEVGDLLPSVSDVSQSAAVFDETIVRAV